MTRLVHPLVAALGMMWVWIEPGQRVIGRAEGEFRDHLWVSWLVQRRVWDDHALPVYFPLANHPDGLWLYPLDPLNQLFLLGLAPLIGLVAAHALLAFGLWSLAGYAGDRLARAAGAGAVPAALAGVALQLGPPVVGTWADTQTEGMGIGWVVWLLAELWDPAPPDRRRAVRVGLLAAAAVLSAPYQAHAVSAVVVPLGLWRFRRHVGLALLAVGLATPALALPAWGLPYAESHADGQLASRSRGGDWPPRTALRVGTVPPEIAQVAASPVALHRWPREARFLPPTTGPRREVGWVAPVLLLLALASARARPLALVAAGYGALAVGTALDQPWTVVSAWRVPLPFDLWYRWYPLGNLTWKPQQYAVLAWCVGVAAIAVAPRPWWLLAALGELQLRGPTPLPLPVMRLAPLPVDEALAGLPRGGVLEFPSRARGPLGPETLPADELLHQLTHGHPIGEPFGRGRNRARQSVSDALAAALGWMPGLTPVEESLGFASRRGFRWLVIHGGALAPGELARLEAVLPGTPRRYDGDVLLYELSP